LKAERQVLRSRHMSAPVAAAADAAITAAQSAIGAVEPAAPAESIQAASPAPPAPPAPPARQSSASISHQAENANGNWTWSNNGEKLQVTYHGRFEFTDDETDVREMSQGGSLKISDGNWLGRHSVEIRNVNGVLEHRYYVNASERPFEPDGRAWLRQNLPKFVRNTGIGADTRVARLLTSGGPAAVMTEIARIDTSYVKGIYYRQLFKQAPLTPAQYRDAMTQAGREMKGSSYDLAQLLMAVADRIPNDDASRAAYFQAASGISSDYEMRRVYSTMLKRGPVSPQILAAILQSARAIKSDYDLSELLREIVSRQDVDGANGTAFFALVAGMHSDYERRRVLSSAVGGTRQVNADTWKAALGAARFSGDYDASTFLQEILRKTDVEGALAPAFFQVVRTIKGSYERGNVLQAVAKNSGASDDTLRAVLQAAQGLGHYELSQLLQVVAAHHTLSGGLRDEYLAAADRLGSYEQTQVMAALVRAERRR
jgi:hypothetical protein